MNVRISGLALNSYSSSLVAEALILSEASINSTSDGATEDHA